MNPTTSRLVELGKLRDLAATAADRHPVESAEAVERITAEMVTELENADRNREQDRQRR